MEQKTVIAEKRDQVKKGTAGRLRRAGKIPAVVYGRGNSLPISLDGHDFQMQFKTVSENTIINLKVGEKDYDVLVKDYQEDILTGKILHIDFYEVEKGKMLRTHIPIHLIGTPIGVREGGIMEHFLHSAEVECVPSNIPEAINIEVAHLKTGQSIHVSDLPALEGVRYLHTPDQSIVSITTVRAEAPAAAEEGEGVEGAEAAEE